MSPAARPLPAVVFLLRLYSVLTATATDGPVQPQPDSQRPAASTSSQCNDSRLEEDPHRFAEENDDAVATKEGDRDKRAGAEDQFESSAASSSLLPWMQSGKPQMIDDDDDYEYAYLHEEYHENAEELRESVMLERTTTEGGRPPTLEEIKAERGCHKLPTAGRPLYTQEDWQRLRQIYEDQGGAKIKYQKEPPADFRPPMRPGQTTDGKGRGLFATRDIKRGEMTYAGVEHYAFFRDAASYRRFLEALTDHEACDVIMWSWTQETMWQRVIMLLLDDNALQNSGSGDKANTGQHPEGNSWGMFDEYALRDIKEGEELLCDYSHFLGSFWDDFGL